MQPIGTLFIQVGHFTAQIAATSLAALQYNILSVTKSFIAYETMGELLEAVFKDSLELFIADRIWGALQKLAIAIATLFGLNDEEIYDAIVNRSEEMNYFCNICKLKLAKLKQILYVCNVFCADVSIRGFRVAWKIYCIKKDLYLVFCL